MKKIFTFIGGFICGIIFIFFVGASVGSDDGLVIFEEDGKCFHTSQLEVFQAIKPGKVLAKIGKFPNDTVVLLLDKDKKAYYDGERINVPQNKCAKQIGTFQYETKMGMKTVPAVVVK